MSTTSWIGRHVDILVIAALFALVLVANYWIRARSAHLCECGHRRDQHDDRWGDDCLKCPCTGFERATITRKDNGDRIDE